jgi:hypothetical protein
LIQQLGILPGKNISQLNLQVQRILGIQSLVKKYFLIKKATYNSIKLDPDRVKNDNQAMVDKNPEGNNKN